MKQQKLTRGYVQRSLRLIMFAHQKYGTVTDDFCNTELEYLYLDTQEQTGEKDPKQVLLSLFDRLNLQDDSQNFTITYQDGHTQHPLDLHLKYSLSTLLHTANKHLQVCYSCGTFNKAYALITHDNDPPQPVCTTCLTYKIDLQDPDTVLSKIRLFRQQLKQYRTMKHSVRLTHTPRGVIARNAKHHIVGTFTRQQWNLLNTKTTRRDEIRTTILEGNYNIQIWHKKPNFQSFDKLQ